jgi:hypothetical protein
VVEHRQPWPETTVAALSSRGGEDGTEIAREIATATTLLYCLFKEYNVLAIYTPANLTILPKLTLSRANKSQPIA